MSTVERVEKLLKLSFQRKLESRKSFEIIRLWIPAFAGMTKKKIGMTIENNFFTSSEAVIQKACK